ncbi:MULTISPECIES: 5-formyltetrahydrofolate cyclo-ligase [unclassified Colwellia]|uniref:5-formyltetrahydrofolate cyclo-ligase n=1 Tax=unclassified Colwellia TaxID=196834 RepID=UPI0015F6F84A|nr:MULTISPECIES: 5-formyltetrahydrofolate cyclo-ligase [unclassified Colwellia]MBA6233471.1 5-formyltetrahydrofolate cyclo-ligase [Colwellia sp. MB02u-7]MBA6236561.1 5-formyltetrahydrofolate cyclo-ligase [Colwellia sp. MB02u-11]MBA6298040.1 5-formyltetrahydrofolate cyclo-ligase [Colwellia sp. MB3u-22]MBA6312136.1 5-formyltetrahydrofolate cyclo-ligase [Colwellia sp. MB3u-64]
MKTRDVLRQEIRYQRSLLNADQQAEQSLLLSKRLIKEKVVKGVKHIAIYLANDGELNTQPFIDWCWQNNITVYLPVIHPFSQGNLLFLHYTETSSLIKNKYGILEPKLDVRHIITVANLDIIFTPLVAFDRYGNRLGMGGGFYDRTLATWYAQYKQNQQTKPLPIGLAHDCQKVDNIPSETWDIPLLKIITPTISYHFDI